MEEWQPRVRGLLQKSRVVPGKITLVLLYIAHSQRRLSWAKEAAGSVHFEYSLAGSPQRRWAEC